MPRSIKLLNHLYLYNSPKKFARLLLCFILYLLDSTLIPSKINASYFEINPTIKSAYSEIIKTKLSTGRAILEKDKSNNGFKIYLKSYADLIQLLITEDKVFYEQFLDNQSSRLKYLVNLDKKSPYARVLQAEVHLHSAFVKLSIEIAVLVHPVVGSDYLDIIQVVHAGTRHVGPTRKPHPRTGEAKEAPARLIRPEGASCLRDSPPVSVRRPRAAPRPRR